ncbi:MAG: porin [Methylobacterium sp.]|nr:porin [Methylobacterium sp.]
MKLVKSLLLGSAAGLVAVAGASAADLGVKKPTAVEYVKTCPQYGAGFFVVPGTTSCLKMIGRIRVEAIQATPTVRTADSNLFRVRGYIGYDHRTATEYGLLRTYLRGYLQRENSTGGAIAGVNATAANAVLEYAFIQFGGLTVGRITPVFEHGWSNLFAGSGAFGGHSDISYVNSFGYTFQFGGGFSATVALDSARERQVAIRNGTYAGQTMPDIVGSLDYAGSWGAVKLAGAIHQIRAQNPTTGDIASSKYGFAIGLNTKINLPMISAGSNIWGNVTYSDGATSYGGFGSSANIGRRTYNFDDAGFVGSSLRTTKAWALHAGLEIFAAPTVRLGLYGSYAQIDPTGASNTITTGSVWGQAAWLPVSGFLIGAEVGYVNARGGTAANMAALNAPATVSRSQNQWVGRVRFQRDF